MNKKLIIIIILIASKTFPALSGDNALQFTDHIFDKRIKTVQLYRQEWNLSYPIIKLNSTDKLVLHFDLIDDNPGSYSYTLIHCTKDWENLTSLPATILRIYLG